MRQSRSRGRQDGKSGAGRGQTAEAAPAEARLHAIFEASHDAMGVAHNGVHLFVNRAYLALFGLPPGTDLEGTSVLDLIAPEGRGPCREYLSRQARGEPGPSTCETRGLRADGTAFDLEVSASLCREGGEELSLLILRDVTARTQAAEALRRSERTLQAIFDTEPACIKIVSRDSRLVMMNRAGLGMIQADSLEQVVGRDISSLVAPGFRQAFRELSERVFRGVAGTLEFQMVGLRGEPRWLETHAVPLRGERGEIVALLGVTRDVTARRQADEALRESEERYRVLAESLPLTIFEMDLQGRFTFVNRAALETFGYTREQFEAGVSLSQVLVPGDRERARQVMSLRLAGEAGGYHEYQAQRTDGRTFPITVAASPILRDGVPVGLRGIVVNLAERKQLEEERLKAQKLESIGTLAGGIAHDFNNLLQGIFGYISVAKAGLDAQSAPRGLLERAEQALHQSVSLTSQLLTFAKGGRPVKRVIALRPVIEGAVRLALSGSRVAFDLSFADGLSTVEADEGQLGQVFQNIALNAEQAMPAGGTLAVAARNLAAAAEAPAPGMAPGAAVEIRFRDQGVGIPAEHRERIFDPYFTTKERGSGLGLATAYSIVRSHGGAISVVSEPGKGTSVVVCLPASGAPVEQAPPPREGRAARVARVLVMDDEAVVRDVVRELLRALGHEVSCVANGAEAIARYREAMAAGRPFEVVILDLTIRGGMGGMDTLCALREADPAVKAVVSSGYSGDGGLAEYRRWGFRAFLKKPYVMRELKETLDALLA